LLQKARHRELLRGLNQAWRGHLRRCVRSYKCKKSASRCVASMNGLDSAQVENAWIWVVAFILKLMLVRHQLARKIALVDFAGPADMMEGAGTCGGRAAI
jgi:hypothetical protein